MIKMIDFDKWFEKRHGKKPHYLTDDYGDYVYLKHETGKAWSERQAVIDAIERIVRSERGHISYCDAPRSKEMFKKILEVIGKPDPKETNSNVDEWANPLG